MASNKKKKNVFFSRIINYFTIKYICQERLARIELRYDKKYIYFTHYIN